MGNMDHHTIWKSIEEIKKNKNGCDKLYEEFIQKEPLKKLRKYTKTNGKILKIYRFSEQVEQTNTGRIYMRNCPEFFNQFVKSFF